MGVCHRDDARIRLNVLTLPWGRQLVPGRTYCISELAANPVGSLQRTFVLDIDKAVARFNFALTHN